MTKINYIINILLLLFSILLIFTLKTVAFHYLTILCNIFNKPEYIKDLFEIYDIYFRKTIQLDIYDKAPMIFDYYIKFRFEEVLFKFSILSITLLLFFKYKTVNIQSFIFNKNYYLLYILFVTCFCFITLYQPAPEITFFFLSFKYYINNEINNIFQYITFIIFLIMIILYIIINIFIIHEATFSIYLKFFIIILSSYFMYYFFMATWDFLYSSIELAKIGDKDLGATFLYKSYGIPVADCMNAQPMVSVEKCKECHEWTKKVCKSAMTTRDPATTLQCKELLNFFNENCKTIIAESKK